MFLKSITNFIIKRGFLQSPYLEKIINNCNRNLIIFFCEKVLHG